MEIGVDIIEINRIKRACKRGDFVNRFFTPKELESVEGIRNYHIHLAGKFAAKEAVVKALGTGFRDMKWTDIEILNKPSGKPIVVLYGKALELFKSKNFTDIRITISHSKKTAIAFAVIFGGETDESC